MFLSIVIPIYNDEAFLNECLDSCLEQELSPSEYEVVCVDDGSTDRSPDILRAYAEQHLNIQVITKQHGTEYGYGRDIGFEAVQGDFVWFVDHDDIIAPHALDILKAAADQAADYDRISFPYYEFHSELTDMERVGMNEGTLTPNSSDSMLQLALWSGIIRVSFLKEHAIYPHSRRIEAAGQFWGIKDFRAWGGDNICMEECFDNGMRTMHLTGKPLYYYRRHDASETMNLSAHSMQSRIQMQYHSALVRAYIALQMKDQYCRERAENGQASRETTASMVMKIRGAALRLSHMRGKLWREGLRLFREHDLLIRKKPPEYDFSFRSFLKTRTRKELFQLSTYAYYYIYHPAGIRLFHLFTFLNRITAGNADLLQQYRKRKKKRLFKKGTVRIEKQRTDGKGDRA